MCAERLEFGSDGMAYHAMLAAEHVSRYFFARSLCSGKRILDIACGEGYGSQLLSEWGAKEVVGVDNSAAAIEKATALFSGGNVRFVKTDACNLSESFLSREKFDLICSFETIEHVGDLEGFLRNIARLSSADTSIILSCPNDGLLPEGVTNPFHLRAFDLATFKSETEKILGKAAGWFFGTPLQGYIVYPEHGTAAPPGRTMDLAMSGVAGGELWLLPPQHNLAMREENVDFYVGVWGRCPQPRASVASALSQTGFTSLWETHEALKSEFRAEKVAFTEREAELRTAKSALEQKHRELERRTADLRRAEIVLAEERRAALNYRAKADRLYDLKPLISEIAREVWWEKNRRGLPYRVAKFAKRLVGRVAGRPVEKP